MSIDLWVHTERDEKIDLHNHIFKSASTAAWKMFYLQRLPCIPEWSCHQSEWCLGFHTSGSSRFATNICQYCFCFTTGKHLSTLGSWTILPSTKVYAVQWSSNSCLSLQYCELSLTMSLKYRSLYICHFRLYLDLLHNALNITAITKVIRTLHVAWLLYEGMGVTCTLHTKTTTNKDNSPVDSYQEWTASWQLTGTFLKITTVRDH